MELCILFIVLYVDKKWSEKLFALFHPLPQCHVASDKCAQQMTD